MLTRQEYDLLLSNVENYNDQEIEWAFELINEYEKINKIKNKFTLTEKQKLFCNAKEDEVLYGGAAGGGKSYAQLIDAYVSSLEYPGIKQLVLRQSFAELNRSLILNSLIMYDQSICKYKSAEKKWIFQNGSMIEFGYCSTDGDVQQFQSAEYDIIRFDELTHFTEFQYTYMISRLRGGNDFPKQIKSSTNPGSRGHAWVKEKFIEDKQPLQTYKDHDEYSRIFIPAKVQENIFLMEKDPGYIKKLKKLPEMERRALLEGDWDLFEGQYFPEWRTNIHVIQPISLNPEWKRFISLDYGLDMTAALWYAKDTHGKCYVYRELHEKDLNIPMMVKRIKDLSPESEKISYIVASPDLFNRRQETGRSGVDIMKENGLRNIVRANDARINGWRNLKDYLIPYVDEQDVLTTKLVIFSNCYNIIKYIPMLQHDKLNPEDVADKPHNITHAPESLRYGIMSLYSPPAPRIRSLS